MTECVCGQTAEEFFTHEDDCAVWLDGVREYKESLGYVEEGE